VTATAVAASTAAVAAGAVVASLDSWHVFATWFVAGVAYVALAVAGFVPLEVVKGASATVRHRSGVAVAWIITVVDVAVETRASVIPRPSSDEKSAIEPVRPVVAIGSTGVGRVVEVPVRAYRSYSNADPDLGRCCRSGAQQRNRNSGKNERFEMGHWFS
jgi:hypothetical protein